MKRIKKFNQINESSDNDIKISLTIEMSEESGKNLQRYFDCNSAETAIKSYLSDLYELEGVDFFDIKVTTNK